MKSLFFFEIRFEIGYRRIRIAIPMTDDQPILVISIAKTPISSNGKVKDMVIVTILDSKTAKSLAKRLVIVPMSDDLTVYDDNFDIFA